VTDDIDDHPHIIAVHISIGVFTVVPRHALSLLTWRELEGRVCGDPQLDLSLLRRRTVYAPRNYNDTSPVVQHFWQTLQGFSHDDRVKFLQFSWARSRLPPDASRDPTWRMKVISTTLFISHPMMMLM
jgi:hypothetical protein